MPDAFTDDDLASLGEHARSDPRLALAVEHAGRAGQAGHGKVTQFLAGAPQLLTRYRDADPPTRALIHEAMDARRLGHSPALPLAFLAYTAEGYLDDEFTDSLEQHARTERRYMCPLASFGEAASRDAGTPDDLKALADSASARCRFRHAAILLHAAGDADAIAALAELRNGAGDHEGAVRLRRQAAAAGHPGSLAAEVSALLHDDDHAQAECLTRQAVDSATAEALMALACVWEW